MQTTSGTNALQRKLSILFIACHRAFCQLPPEVNFNNAEGGTLSIIIKKRSHELHQMY